MAARRPFIFTVRYPEGISESAFRRLSSRDKHSSMAEWFIENFSAPNERLPHFQLWKGGGPFVAHEELTQVFGKVASSRLILEVAQALEGTETFLWDSNDKYDRQFSLQYVANNPGPNYGTAEDHAKRKEATEALKNLDRVISSPPPIGIGHNQPPESIFGPGASELDKLRPFLKKLQAELRKRKPAIPVVKKLGIRLGRIAAIFSKWIGRKIDLMADETAKTTGRALGIAFVAAADPSLQVAIIKAYEAIENWLLTVTR
jgi:hypothetical protein